jgi:hypothetical protein
MQAQDSRIATIVRENEFDSVTVHNPNESLPEDIMPNFVDAAVACKAFAQMRMQPYFIAATLPSAEANGVEDSL